MLNNLAVAADYRNRGVAKRLVKRRINHAETQFGDDYAVVASVQNGNAPSKAVAESWADEFTYNRSTLALEPTPDAEESGEYEIRDATVEEFAAFAEHANAFYADAELFSPYTTDEIEDSRSRSPVDEPIRRYMVALDGNEIVAGAEIQDQYKALWISVTGDGELPPAIPEGGEIRPKSIVNPWCTDGNEDAVWALIEFIRANPDGANRISIQSSPNDPFASLFTDKLGARTVMEYTTPIRGVDELKPDRPVASPY